MAWFGSDRRAQSVSGEGSALCGLQLEDPGVGLFVDRSQDSLPLETDVVATVESEEPGSQ
jgi:hypothetical protein